MKTAVIFIILGFIINSVYAQQPDIAAYRIRAQNRSLTIKFLNKSYRVDVREHIDAAKITETRILFADEKDGFRYLVIDVSGWSREKQNDRQCGAGIESNLLWLKLDSAWNALDVKSVRYQSCWSGTEINEAFKITRNSLLLDFDNIRDRRRVKLSYNSQEPEKGFQIEETKITEY